MTDETSTPVKSATTAAEAYDAVLRFLGEEKKFCQTRSELSSIPQTSRDWQIRRDYLTGIIEHVVRLRSIRPNPPAPPTTAAYPQTAIPPEAEYLEQVCDDALKQIPAMNLESRYIRNAVTEGVEMVRRLSRTRQLGEEALPDQSSYSYQGEYRSDVGQATEVTVPEPTTAEWKLIVELAEARGLIRGLEMGVEHLKKELKRLQERK